METTTHVIGTPKINPKEIITHKLFEALGELKLRAKDGKLGEVQRMYGVALGLAIALMELNKLDGMNPYSYAGYLGMRQLLTDGFGKMTLAQIRAYAFPPF